MVPVKVLEVHLVGDGVSLDRALAGSASAATKAASTMEAAGVRITKTGTKMSAAGRTWTRALSLPLLAVGALAVKSSLDFNRSMSLISTQAGGSAKEVKKLSVEVLNLAKNSKFGPKELSDSLFHVESTGYRGAKAMGILGEASKLATVGNSNLEVTTYALVSAVKALGVEGIKPTANMAAELNSIVAYGDVRMEALTKSLSSGALPTFRAAGLGMRDFGAALDVMTARGEPAEVAAYRLRMAVSLMSAPSEKAAKALKEIGLGTTDLAETMRNKGIGPAVAELAEHLAKFSKTEANQVLSDAFGGGRSSGAIKTLVLNYEELLRKERLIGKGVENYSKKVKEAEHTKLVEVQKAWSSIQASLVEIGNDLVPIVVPAFQRVATAIGEATQWFRHLSKSSREWVTGITAALILGGPILTGLGFMLKGWGKLITLIGKAGVALGIFNVEAASGGAIGAAGGVAGGAGSVASSAGAGAAAGWLGTEASQSAYMAEQNLTIGMTERQALASQGGIFAGIAGGAGAGAASGGIKGAAKALGRTILGIAGGVIAAELSLHGLEAMGVKDPTEGQGILTSLTHGFNTSAPAGKRSQQEGDEIVGARLMGIHPKLSVEAAKKLKGQFNNVMSALQTDAIFGMGHINNDLEKGLHLATTLFAKNTPKWHQYTVHAMRSAIDAIKEGMASGVIDTKEGQEEINQLLRRIKFVQGRDPVGIAEGMAQSFKEAGSVTKRGVKQWINQLSLMPQSARESASDATLGMLKEWAAGHPKLERQIEQITNYQVRKFGATNKQLREGVKKGATGPVAEAYKELAKGVAGSLSNIGRNTQEVLRALGAKNIGDFKIQYATGGGSRFTSPSETPGLGHTHRAMGGPIGHVVPGRGSGDIVDAALPPESFVLNKKATEYFYGSGYQHGGHVPVKLEPKERVFLPREVKEIGFHNLTAMNKRVPRFAHGGLVHPHIEGGLPTLAALGNASIDKVYHAALQEVRAARAAIAAAGPGGKTAYGPKGIGTYMGVPMANWVIQALQYGAAHGSGNPQPTSGYRPGFDPMAPGGSEHAKIQYPGGAVDFGGMVDPSAYPKKMAVVRATAGFKYPLLAPIGFRDDGHASGTGHQLGGLVNFAKGGTIGSAKPAHLSKSGQHLQALVEQVWPFAAHFYPGAGSKPPLTNYDTHAWGGAFVGDTKVFGPHGGLRKNYVGFPVWFEQWLHTKPNIVKETMIHEWAHYFQRNKLANKDWEREGGAEAFARWAAPQIFGAAGIPYRNPPFGKNQPYYPFVQRVLREKGMDWVERGQFRRGGLVGFAGGGQLHGPPLFHGEGPQWYGDAFRHNHPWVTHQAPWQTRLSGVEERQFRAWVQNHHVPFDSNARRTDYDMRGFWKATGGTWQDGHFPDTWKTPYDTTFSNESRYAKPGTPFVWTPDYKWLYDRRTGQIISSGRFAVGGLVNGYSVGGSVPPKSGEVVGASIFGGPSDPSTGTVGYKGDSLPGKMAFAELAMGTALGGLPYRAKLNIGHAGKSVVAEKLDIGQGGGDVAGHNRAIDLWYQTAAALNFSGTGLVKVTPEGSTGGSTTEKVPGMFHGAHTKSLHIPSIPQTLGGVKREIHRWTHELNIYERAAHAAKNKPKTLHAIQANITSIQKHLKELRRARKKLRIEAAKKRFSKHLAHNLGKITGYETTISGKERALEIAEQYAQQVVSLEPQQGKDEDGKVFEAKYDQYIENEEKPAYLKVLELAGNLRNTILGAEILGFGKGKPSADDMERVWEKRVRDLSHEIEHIEKLKAPKGKKARKHFEEQRAKLPMLKFKKHELEETVKAARESFFGGNENRISPPPIPLPFTGSFEDALINVQGIHGADQHEYIGTLPRDPVPGRFGGQIWDTQMAIRELGLKIAEAGGASSSSTDSEKIALLEEQRTRERQERAGLEADISVLASGLGGIGPKGLKATFPWAGRFSSGGYVSALVGEEGPELATFPTGTRIRGAQDTQSLLQPKVEVHNYHYGDRTETEVMIDGKKMDAIVNHVRQKLGGNVNHLAQTVSDGRVGTL